LWSSNVEPENQSRETAGAKSPAVSFASDRAQQGGSANNCEPLPDAVFLLSTDFRLLSSLGSSNMQ
jgi:hypothetical protein